MRRLLIIGLLILFSLPAFATHTCGTGVGGGVCYIAANGNDSNSGATTSLPWLHAPGMPNATGNAGSQVPIAGDRYVFRGGDSWHFSNSGATVYMGGAWSWSSSWNGTAGSCQIDPSNGTVVTTSCIYIGVDVTYFTGGSWTRPKFNFDNPLSTSVVGSCTFNDDIFNGTHQQGNYIIIDNLEFLGYCTTSAGNSGMLDNQGSPVWYTNNYFHGWSQTSGAAANGSAVMNCNGSGCSGTVRSSYNVVDGGDSTYAGTYGAAMTGFDACTILDHNIFRWLANNCVESSGHSGGSGKHLYFDNLFEYMYNASGGHGNIIEMQSGSGGNSTGDVYYCGNITRHTNEGVGIDLIPANGGNVYICNNAFYDIGHATGCIGPNGNGGATAINAYIYNNTVDNQPSSQNNNPNGGCAVSPGVPINVFYENNHLINFSPAVLSSFGSTGTAGADNGGEKFQTEAVANGQGYNGCQGTPTCSTGSDYSVTSGAGSTINAGNNLTSFYSGLTFYAATSSMGSVTLISYGGGEGASSPAYTPNARGTTWDSGAYQFSAPPASTDTNLQGVTNRQGAIVIQ